MLAFPVPLTKAFMDALPEGLARHAPHLGKSDAERSVAAGFGYGNFAEMRAAIAEFPENRRFDPKTFSRVATATGAMASGSEEAGGRAVLQAMTPEAGRRIGMERPPLGLSNGDMDGMPRALRLLANLPAPPNDKYRVPPHHVVWALTLDDVREPKVTERAVLFASASLGLSDRYRAWDVGVDKGAVDSLWYRQSLPSERMAQLLDVEGFGQALPAALKASGMMPHTFCRVTGMPFSVLRDASLGNLAFPEGAKRPIVDVLTHRVKEADVRPFFPQHWPETFDHEVELRAVQAFDKAHRREIGILKTDLRDADLPRESLRPLVNDLIAVRMAATTYNDHKGSDISVEVFVRQLLRPNDLELAWVLRELGPEDGLRRVQGYVNEMVEDREAKQVAPSF